MPENIFMATCDIISYLWTNVILIRRWAAGLGIGLDSFVAITITINIDCLAGRHTYIAQAVLKAASTHTHTQS